MRNLLQDSIAGFGPDCTSEAVVGKPRAGVGVPTMSRKGGADMIREALAIWNERHPIYVVVEVTGAGKDGQPYRVSGLLERVGEHVDQVGRTFLGSKARLMGFGTDRNWARSQGDEV